MLKYQYNLDLPYDYFGADIHAPAFASRYQVGLNSKEMEKLLKREFLLSDDEYDNLIYLAAGIPATESSFETGLTWKVKNNLKNRVRKHLGDIGVKLGIGVDRMKRHNWDLNEFLKGYRLGESKGAINLKHKTPERYMYFQAGSPELQAISALYHLATLYAAIRDKEKIYYKGNIQGTLTEMPIWDRVALMYNQGSIKAPNGVFQMSSLDNNLDVYGVPLSYPTRLKTLVNSIGFSKNGEPMQLKNNTASQDSIPLAKLNTVGYTGRFFYPFSNIISPTYFEGSHFLLGASTPISTHNLENKPVIIPNTEDVQQALVDIDLFGNLIGKDLFFKIHKDNKTGDYILDVWNTQYDTPEQRKKLTLDYAKNIGKSKRKLKWENLDLLRKNLEDFKSKNKALMQLIESEHERKYMLSQGWIPILPLKVVKEKSNLDYDKERLKELYVPGEAWAPYHNMDGERAVDPRTGQPIYECSRWGNCDLLNSKYPSGNPRFNIFEVGDDAWNRLTSGNNEKLLYTGFLNIPLTFGLPFNKNLENLIKLNNIQAAVNFSNNFDMNQLDPNENYVVSMTYKHSPHVRDAYEQRSNRNETTNTSTHTGNVYLDPNTFDWRVVHNVDSWLRDLKMTDLMSNFGNFLITGIAKLHKNPNPKTPKQILENREVQKQAYLKQVVDTALRSKRKYVQKEQPGLLRKAWNTLTEMFGY